jgi:hypothetical protein
MPAWGHPENPNETHQAAAYEMRLAGIHIPPNPSFQKRAQTQTGFRIPLSGSRSPFNRLLYEKAEPLAGITMTRSVRQGRAVIEHRE